MAAFGWLARLLRVADLHDLVEACRRVDFTLFMVENLGSDELDYEAPAIVGQQETFVVFTSAKAISAAGADTGESRDEKAHDPAT